MALDSTNKTIKAYDGFRYKHVQSENIEELISCMGKQFKSLLLQFHDYKSNFFQGYGWLKKWRLRRSSTVFLQKRINLCWEEYELIEMRSDKTAFIPGHEPCIRSFSFANGWQSKRYFFEGNKLVKVQQGKKKVVTIWEFSENELSMTVKVADVVAKKFYKRTHDSGSGCYAWCEKWFVC